MIFGHVYLGAAESLDGECVKTRFLVVGLPLMPIEAMYCVRSRGFRVEGFPVQWNHTSILLGYLRWAVLFEGQAKLIAEQLEAHFAWERIEAGL